MQGKVNAITKYYKSYLTYSVNGSFVKLVLVILELLRYGICIVITIYGIFLLILIRQQTIFFSICIFLFLLFRP